MTLIASYGGNASNAYIDLTQANSFIRTAVFANEEWFDLSGTERAAILMQATRDIDSRQYVGTRRFFAQFLEFPRELRSSFPWNRTTQTETTTGDDTQRRMLRDVTEACALQAVFLARQGGRNEHAERLSQGIRSISEGVGPIREFVQYGQRATGQSARLAQDVVARLSEWTTTRRVIRK
jgi:hypothetical protein